MRSRSLVAALLLWPVVACGASGDGPSEPEVPSDQPKDTGVWTLVWQDEFDGNTLDASKWSVQTGDGCDLGICGWGNNELQWYQAANLTIGSGFLTIAAKRQSVGGKPYTSTRIRSAGKGDWTYARIEARARLPKGRGIWPAIWMLPTDNAYGPWAASGEIDIMELVGHEPSTVHGTIHYGDASPNNRSSGASYTLQSGTFADAFHTFALEWEAGVMRWFVDGQLYQTQTRWSTTTGGFPAPFNRRFHLLINLAVGGNWPGSPDASTVLPQDLVVDWVRVYQRK